MEWLPDLLKIFIFYSWAIKSHRDAGWCKFPSPHPMGTQVLHQEKVITL